MVSLLIGGKSAVWRFVEHLVELPEFLQNCQDIADPKLRAEAIKDDHYLKLFPIQDASSHGETRVAQSCLRSPRISRQLLPLAGTDVGLFNGLLAGWRALRADNPLKRREELLRFNSIWPGSETAITNIMHDRMLVDIEHLLSEGSIFLKF